MIVSLTTMMPIMAVPSTLKYSNWNLLHFKYWILQVSVIVTCNRCAFSYNEADYSGGATYTRYLSTMKLDGCVLATNYAVYFYGGAVYVYSDGKVVINNTNFYQNSASYDGGAIKLGSETDGQITQSSFTENSASNYGGILLYLFLIYII